MEGRSIPLGDAYVDFTEHEPMGISAQIIPWNYPVEMAARSIAPALATGNACIIKSPELDPLSSICFAAAAEHAGLPPAAANSVGWAQQPVRRSPPTKTLIKLYSPARSQPGRLSPQRQRRI